MNDIVIMVLGFFGLAGIIIYHVDKRLEEDLAHYKKLLIDRDEDVRAEINKKFVSGAFLDRLRIPERILEIEAAAERAVKKAETAEFVAHSAKMTSQRPHRIILTIEELPRVPTSAKKQLKKIISKAGRA